MARTTSALGAALTLATLGLVQPQTVSAQETGLHKLHNIARSGNMLCMTSHAHYGESLPSGTKGTAMKTAINKWVIFTSEEYGKIWGSYERSAGKRETCKGAPGSIVCSVESRPCRPL